MKLNRFKLIKFQIIFFISSLIVVLGCKKVENETLPKDFSNIYGFYQKNKGTHIDSLIKAFRKSSDAYTLHGSPYFAILSSVINGHILNLNGDYPSSIKSFQKAIDVNRSTVMPDSIMTLVYSMLGQAYNNSSQFDLSIENLIIAENLARKPNVAQSHLNYALIAQAKVYFTKGEPEKAINFINKAKSETDSTLILPSGMHLLANYYGQAGKIDKALEIDNMYINLLSKTDNLISISPFYNNKANCFLALGKVDSAIVYIQKSIHIDSLNKDIKNIGANYLLFAEASILKKNYPAAKNYLTEAKRIFREVNHMKNLYDAHGLSKTIALQQNDYALALGLTDSLQDVRKNIDGVNLQARIEAINIANDTSRKEIENTTILNNLKFVIIALSLVFGLIALALYQRSIRTKQKSLLDLQQQMQKANAQVIKAEQEERLRIASDLHDSLGQKLTALKMFNTENQSSKFSGLLEETIVEVRNISHNLRPEILTLGLVSAVKDLCFSSSNQRIQCNLVINPGFENIKLDNTVSFTLYRCIQECINNALKHSGASNIDIRMVRKHSSICIEIRDNGSGFSVDKVKMGMGLNSISARMNAIHGNVSYQLGTPGTLAQLTIPYVS